MLCSQLLLLGLYIVGAVTMGLRMLTEFAAYPSIQSSIYLFTCL
jgi:hypothetical protein